MAPSLVWPGLIQKISPLADLFFPSAPLYAIIVSFLKNASMSCDMSGCSQFGKQRERASLHELKARQTPVPQVQQHALVSDCGVFSRHIPPAVSTFGLCKVATTFQNIIRNCQSASSEYWYPCSLHDAAVDVKRSRRWLERRGTRSSSSTRRKESLIWLERTLAAHSLPFLDA